MRKRLQSEIMDRCIPLGFATILYYVLRAICTHVYDPCPGQSVDFLRAIQFAGVAMAIVGRRNKVVECLAALSPAFVGTLDELFHFLPMSYVGDVLDVIAFFLGCLCTYFGATYLRSKLLDTNGNTKRNSL
jgi:hypothetical protein